MIERRNQASLTFEDLDLDGLDFSAVRRREPIADELDVDGTDVDGEDLAGESYGYETESYDDDDESEEEFEDVYGAEDEADDDDWDDEDEISPVASPSHRVSPVNATRKAEVAKKRGNRVARTLFALGMVTLGTLLLEDMSNGTVSKFAAQAAQAAEDHAPQSFADTLEELREEKAEAARERFERTRGYEIVDGKFQVDSQQELEQLLASPKHGMDIYVPTGTYEDMVISASGTVEDPMRITFGAGAELRSSGGAALTLDSAHYLQVSTARVTEAAIGIEVVRSDNIELSDVVIPGATDVSIYIHDTSSEVMLLNGGVAGAAVGLEIGANPTDPGDQTQTVAVRGMEIAARETGVVVNAGAVLAEVVNVHTRAALPVADRGNGTLISDSVFTDPSRNGVEVATDPAVPGSGKAGQYLDNVAEGAMPADGLVVSVGEGAAPAVVGCGNKGPTTQAAAGPNFACTE